MVDYTPELLMMLKLQDEANQSVHPDWRRKGWNWSRAIWTEAGEMMDLLNWFWWKDKPITPAVASKIDGEAIDILHFYLAALIQSNRGSQEHLAKLLNRFWLRPESFPDTIDYKLVADEVENLVHIVFDRSDEHGGLPADGGVINAFSRLSNALHLQIPDLFYRYAGKNCLNQLRQFYGYSQGLYQREWDGFDDNQHLKDIQDMYKDIYTEPRWFITMVYDGLDKLYQEYCPVAAHKAREAMAAGAY